MRGNRHRRTQGRRRLEIVPLCLLLAPATFAQAPADVVFRGGTIVTLTGSGRAEALAVEGERIVAVGEWAAIAPRVGPSTRVVELGEEALLPGFVDAHGHLSMVAQVVGMANLGSPPVGRVESIPDLIAELRRWAEETGGREDGWILGWGYDDSLLAERRHPRREELDEAFPHRPVFLVHVSGHLACANSLALELAGIRADTPDPPGGHIRRRHGSREPDGVLEESAQLQVRRVLPAADLEESLDGLDAALALYARNGITTAQDGATSPDALKLLREAARRERLSLDVIAYPLVGPGPDEAPTSLEVGRYRGRLKVGGVKLILDGSPQGKTAYLTRPFLVPPPGQPPGYRGYPAMPQEEVDGLVARFLGAGVPILAHANGDAAADQLLLALERAGATPARDHRTVMIHAQVLRPDQLDRIAALGVVPSFFVAHTFYWGDWHRDSVLGGERAERISPARDAAERSIRFTFHNDAPVVPPDMVRLVWTGVNRRTRSGDILGPGQRVGVAQALRAVTLDAAYQTFEEAEKGSLEVGKLADLVILSRDPLALAPDRLLELAVVETFSHGRSIYRQGEP